MTLHFRNISLTYVCTKQIFFFFFSELNKTKIYYIAQSDIGGYVPRSLIDNTLPQAVMDFFSNIKKTIEADGCNEFSFWCWLPMLQDALTSIKRQTADVVLAQITIQLFINMYRPDTSTLCIDTTTHYAVCMYHTKTADKSPYTLLKQRWYIFLWILMYSFHGLTDLTNFLYSMVMQPVKLQQWKMNQRYGAEKITSLFVENRVLHVLAENIQGRVSCCSVKAGEIGAKLCTVAWLLLISHWTVLIYCPFIL
mgnify:CR=1 FL=1